MNKSILVTLAAVVVLTGCSSTPGPIQAVGTVTDQAQHITVPQLVAPTVNLDAGFPAAATTPSSGATTPPTSGSGASDQQATNSTATIFGLGSTWQIAKVLVTVGDTVAVGAPLAMLDPAQLQLQVTSAKADAAVAAAQVDVLDTAIRDTYTKASDVAATREKVRAAITKLTSTQADLETKANQLMATRQDLTTKLEKVDAALANPLLPPPQVAQLKAARSKLRSGIARINAGLAQIAKAAPQLRNGLTQARSGLATLNKASATISDARSQLRGVRDLAQIAADTAKIGVDLAKVQRSQTVLAAPVSGVVVMVVQAGERLAPGATVAAVRPTGDSLVTAWLPVPEAAAVCVGDRATISGDWMAPGASVTARLDWVAPTADYPPTSTTTQEVHLLRAVQVQLSTDAELPAGVSVDITVDGCHRGNAHDKENR